MMKFNTIFQPHRRQPFRSRATGFQRLFGTGFDACIESLVGFDASAPTAPAASGAHT